jgi:hypothetical protein
MDKNRIGGVSVGRAGRWSRSPFPSRTQSVDSAAVHGRRLNLPREICWGSRLAGTEDIARCSDPRAEVRRGPSTDEGEEGPKGVERLEGRGE